MNRELKKIVLSIPLMAGFFIVLFSYLAFGYLMEIVDFFQSACPVLPVYYSYKKCLYILLFVCHGIVFEYVFRYALLSRLLQEFSARKSFWIHIAFIKILILAPLVYFGFRLNTESGVRLWFYETVMQVFWGLYYWKNLSYIQTGFFHGLFNAVRFIVLQGGIGPIGCYIIPKVQSNFFYDLKIFSAALAVTILVILLNDKQRNVLTGKRA